MYYFQVAHHHHHVPVPVPVSSSYSDYPSYPSHLYDSSGPGSYFHSRTEDPTATTPDLASWGLGDYPSSWDDPRVTRSSSNNALAAAVTEPSRLAPYGGAYQQQVRQYNKCISLHNVFQLLRSANCIWNCMLCKCVGGCHCLIHSN